MTKWSYLIEGDQEIRAAERSGDVEEIIRAYRRAGQTGGGAAAFGRAEIGGWNRRAAKGFNGPTAAVAFIEAALSRNYAVVSVMSAGRHDHEDVLYFTRSTKSTAFVPLVWYGGRAGHYTKSNIGPKEEIQAVYRINAREPGRLHLRYAVIPYSALPKSIRDS